MSLGSLILVSRVSFIRLDSWLEAPVQNLGLRNLVHVVMLITWRICKDIFQSRGAHRQGRPKPSPHWVGFDLCFWVHDLNLGLVFWLGLGVGLLESKPGLAYLAPRLIFHKAARLGPNFLGLNVCPNN